MPGAGRAATAENRSWTGPFSTILVPDEKTGGRARRVCKCDVCLFGRCVYVCVFLRPMSMWDVCTEFLCMCGVGLCGMYVYVWNVCVECVCVRYVYGMFSRDMLM